MPRLQPKEEGSVTLVDITALAILAFTVVYVVGGMALCRLADWVLRQLDQMDQATSELE